jgi:hypothetical protein
MKKWILFWWEIILQGCFKQPSRNVRTFLSSKKILRVFPLDVAMNVEYSLHSRVLFEPAVNVVAGQLLALLPDGKVIPCFPNATHIAGIAETSGNRGESITVII